MYYNDYNRPPEEQDIIETYGYRVSEPIPEPPRKSKGLAAKFVAVGLCCALIGGLAGGVGGWALGGMRGTTTIYQSDRAPTVVNIANVKDRNLLTVPEVYATNVNSTVGISGNVATNVWGQTVRNAVSGSGFIITQDGYILTNYHVIDGVSDIKVTLYDGSTYDAKLVGGEEENDIAVLKVEAQGLTPVVIGKSSDLHVGDQVVAIGNPLGELTFTLTGGYVSAMDRSITMSDGSVMNMIRSSTPPSTPATPAAPCSTSTERWWASPPPSCPPAIPPPPVWRAWASPFPLTMWWRWSAISWSMATSPASPTWAFFWRKSPARLSATASLRGPM